MKTVPITLLHVSPSITVITVYILHLVTKNSSNLIVQFINQTLEDTGIGIIIVVTAFAMRSVLSQESTDKIMKKICVVDDKVIHLENKIKFIRNDINEIKKILDERLP